MISSAVIPAPTAADVERICAIPNLVIRNLQITQAYGQLSHALGQRTGAGANWSSFATWASKQAGQTIRKEDLMRTLQAKLQLQPEVEAALVLVAKLARQLGATQSLEGIKQSTLVNLVANTASRASDAVSRGNKKVFEEIGRHFAEFIATCCNDAAYNESNIASFVSTLQPGPPPNGQAYLQQAFYNFYRALFERDEKQRAELLFLANLQIGFHEQTRLQPEIDASFNAANINSAGMKTKLMQLLFPPTSYISRFRLFWHRLLQQTTLFDKAVETLTAVAQQHLRKILTAQLMALHLPPDNRLQLSRDLTQPFPPCLEQLSNPQLLSLLQQLDLTPNSTEKTGAVDWTDLPQRMHFIGDLFRCYHLSESLFQNPFTPEQVKALNAGVLPPGPL